MDVRIDKITKNNLTVILVTGELRGQGIIELKRLCRETPEDFVLDLSNLQFLETNGVKLIRDLAAKGVQIKGATPYVSLLLETS